MLPRDSDAIVALKSVIEKILKSHGKEDEYVVLAATGQESKSVKEIKDFEQVLKDYPDKKTIVLTLQRWNRGTSQPWNGIFMMNDTQSLEEYFQTAFRCTTPYEGKDYGYVFDFNPNRTLLMINAYARKRAESKGETDPEKIIKELLDVFCIYSVEGGTEFKRVNTVDLVLDAVTNSIYPAQTLRNSAKAYTEVSYGNLSSELLELLEGAPSISKSWKHDINKSSHKKGKNWKYKSIPKRKLTDKEKQESDKLISKIGTMIAKLPLICELGSPGYSSVEEIVEKVDGVMFEGATDTPKKALELIMSGKHGVKLNTYKINLQLIDNPIKSFIENKPNFLGN